MLSGSSVRSAPGTQDHAAPSTSGRPSGGARTSAAASQAEGSSRWSLERRLPVLLFLLLTAVVGGLSLAAYGEVRGSAIRRATDRLESVGGELALSAARSTMTRVESLKSLAADGVIVRAVAGGETARAVASHFAASRAPGDSTIVGWQIAALDGSSRHASPWSWSSRDSAMLAATVAEVRRSSSDRRSALYAVGEQVHGWSVVPVIADGRMAGTLAELHRVSDNRAAEQAIRGLIDDEARVLFTSRGSGEWVSLRGRPVAPPFALPPVEGRAARVEMAGAGAFAVQRVVPMTPWVIVVLQSEASVLRRPQEFLRKLLAAGAVILAIATLGAWLLSRYVTRPLLHVTDAAAALAGGDYGRRVRVSDGGREVASLSATFNAMAAAIGEAHATLADRNLELQRANAAKSEFLAMMSHELRTPLNAIGGFTELMELGLRGPVTPEQVQDLGRIRRNKDLLLAIINDILNFARTDAGAIAVKLEPLPLAPLIADAVDGVGHQFDARGLRLAAGAVPPDAIARGDRERVQQILLNLLSNALKFTEPGGEVAIETSVSDYRVCIDVRDTGSGIDAAHHEAIFEPFVQVDASLTRTSGGAGLGLAIARQLATAMAGTLTVRSTLGSGSTFTLTLPHVDLPEPVLDASAVSRSTAEGQIA
jgi:signal transduction histidine kinase